MSMELRCELDGESARVLDLLCGIICFQITAKPSLSTNRRIHWKWACNILLNAVEPRQKAARKLIFKMGMLHHGLATALTVSK
jgi:hypothetical protein